MENITMTDIALCVFIWGVISGVGVAVHYIVNLRD